MSLQFRSGWFDAGNFLFRNRAFSLVVHPHYVLSSFYKIFSYFDHLPSYISPYLDYPPQSFSSEPVSVPQPHPSCPHRPPNPNLDKYSPTNPHQPSWSSFSSYSCSSQPSSVPDLKYTIEWLSLRLGATWSLGDSCYGISEWTFRGFLGIRDTSGWRLLVIRPGWRSYTRGILILCRRLSIGAVRLWFCFIQGHLCKAFS